MKDLAKQVLLEQAFQIMAKTIGSGTVDPKLSLEMQDWLTFHRRAEVSPLRVVQQLTGCNGCPFWKQSKINFG